MAGIWPSFVLDCQLPHLSAALCHVMCNSIASLCPITLMGTLDIPPQILPPRDTLVIAFLACLHLREAVTPMDIARWALDGDLPFLDLPSRSKALLAAKQGVPLPAQALQASLADPPVAFLRRVASMAESVGLPLALVNGLPLLQRAVLDLQLPKVCGPVRWKYSPTKCAVVNC